MRTIKQLVIPQNSSVQFPDSTILNETDLVDGTPVVEEIYGDVLTNIYNLLRKVGVVATGTQDNNSSQYQIVEALTKLPNVLNDIEQVLTLNGSVWSIPLNIDFLPNKYVFIARASDNYVVGATYSFKGSTATSYGFTSSGFKLNDELLVVVDYSGVRAYSLSSSSSSPDVFPSLGNILSFNDTSKIWYQDGGNLLSDVPSLDALEFIVRVNISDGTALINDIFVLNGKVLCFCLIPATNNYFFRQFDLANLTVSAPVVVSGISFGTASDFSPYCFVEKGAVYVSNGANNNSNNYSISKLTYNSVASTLAFVSTANMDVSFDKTTNTAIKGGFIYTMVTGVLNRYSLSTGLKTFLGTFPFVTGQLVGFNGFVYYNSGDVAKKWF